MTRLDLTSMGRGGGGVVVTAFGSASGRVSMIPLMAQSGQSDRTRVCPLLGVKRTSQTDAVMSANDPKRTFVGTQSSVIELTWGLPVLA